MIEVLKALIEDLRLNHEYCPKEVILQAADELEQLVQRTEERNFCPRCGKRLGGEDSIHTCTPPQRTWVGLTDEEMLECNMDGDLMIDRETAKRNVEAKLKEKNT